MPCHPSLAPTDTASSRYPTRNGHVISESPCLHLVASFTPGCLIYTWLPCLYLVALLTPTNIIHQSYEKGQQAYYWKASSFLHSTMPPKPSKVLCTCNCSKKVTHQMQGLHLEGCAKLSVAVQFAHQNLESNHQLLAATMKQP